MSKITMKDVHRNDIDHIIKLLEVNKIRLYNKNGSRMTCSEVNGDIKVLKQIKDLYLN